jgi:hypothetical protein
VYDVYLADRPCGNENQNNHDKDRRNRPRKLNGVATVDLRRLHCVVVGTFAAVTHHGVKEKAPNDQEDDQTNEQGQMRGIINKLSRLREWIKDVLNRANLFGSLRGHGSGQGCNDQQKGSAYQSLAVVLERGADS